MVVIVTAYALSPADMSITGVTLLRVAGALLLITGAIIFTFRSVWNAEYPLLRAVEAISAVVAVLVVTFAFIYLRTSRSDTASFSESLDHTRALYFALTTATTIGFGDITPQTNQARITVMFQMVSNVVILGVATRILISTARRRAESR